MPANFVNIDRATAMLFPQDLREWVPQDDLVHFVIDAIEGIKLPQVHVNQRGTGSPQYPPKMMLALLVYSYATGRFSSRQIEQATYRDTAMIYLCGMTHPDHDTICTFRRENYELFRQCFVEVLQLAVELKLLKVGTVSVDGTKIMANASKHAAVSHQRCGELIEQLELEVEELLRKAEAADDSSPLKDGLRIPEEVCRREQRRANLEAARVVIEARAAERAAAERAEFEKKVAEREARRASGERVRGRNPEPPSETANAKDQYNFTDPESRIMKVGGGHHFEQAYNAQVVVDAEGSMLVLAQRVTDHANDKEELVPTLEAMPAVAGTVTAVVADSGYYSEAAVRKVEADNGPTVYAAVIKASRHVTVQDLEKRPEETPLGEAASAKERMAQRLRSEVGRNLYKRRKETVEPVFGIVKEALGFRQFLLRGSAKVSIEWTLATMAYNFKRLHRLGARSLLASVRPEFAVFA